MITSNQAWQIKQIMDNANIPLHVWLPIMHLESSGNPRAHNQRGEDSRGLFQINVETAPFHVRVMNLFDPIINAIQILGNDWLGNPYRLKQMQGMTNPADQAAFMWRRGIRPRWTDNHDRRIRYYATEGLESLKERYGLTQENIVDHPDVWGMMMGHQPTAEAIAEDVGFVPPEPEVEPGEEAKPSWLTNPFGRLWWEITNAAGRVAIIVFGALALFGILYLLIIGKKGE